MLEHRWIADPGPGKHVHHRNHQRSDNDPANLRALSPGAHYAEHRRVPDATLVALHSDGMTTTAIGAVVGLHPSQVWRRLDALGVILKRPPWNRVDMDEAEVLRLHALGERSPGIAAAVGAPVMAVRRVLHEHGRVTPVGRPPKR